MKVCTEVVGTHVHDNTVSPLKRTWLMDEGELKVWRRCSGCKGRGYLPRALFENAVHDRTCLRCSGKKGGYLE